MKNLLGKLNKKAIIAVIVAGFLVIALLTSAFAMNFFKKEKKSKYTVNQVVENLDYKKLKLDADYVYKKTLEWMDATEQGREWVVHKEKSPGYCKALLKDFKNGKVKLIKPIIQTDNIDDPEFKKYFGNRNYKEALKPFQRSLYEPTENFKIFDIDYDNDPANGKQILFYMGGFFNEYQYLKNKRQTNPEEKRDVYRAYDVYKIIDFNECSRIGGDAVYSTLNYNKKEPSEHFNGVIKYKNTYLIYKVQTENKRFTQTTSGLNWAKIQFVAWYPVSRGKTTDNCWMTLQ